MPKVDHIIFNGEENRIECTICKSWVQFSFPVSIPVFVGVSRVFQRDHKNCKKNDK
jgi:hypothetical protein